ncbi:MAG: hypothetical protein R6W69_10380 [Anaerolineales bacterium]
MSEKRWMSNIEIMEMIKGISDPDWTQIELIRSLPIERRIIPAMRAKAFAMSTYRANLRRRYPNLSHSDLNMAVLKHFTEVRLPRR